MTVFDRSWYGRVLVERVEGFATTEEWSRAYAEIVDFERSLWTEGDDHGQVLAPHLGRGAAAAASRSARSDPLKSWKLTPDDWRNREKRPQYLEAVEDMLARTDHAAARWQLVEGDRSASRG